MEHWAIAPLEKLEKLELELEDKLGRTGSDHPIRNALSVARGHLELTRLYEEPLAVEDVERMLVNAADALPDRKFAHAIMVRVRLACAGFRYLHPVPICE